MKQLVQKLSDGRPFIQETPAPTPGRGEILVRNFYSVISSGTEGATVRSARKNIIAKAMERPKDVKMVLDLLKRQGPAQTYRAVMKKLDAYSPMGYTTSGQVVAVGADVDGFEPGDMVACAGVGYASHAEFAAVPVNLCVKLPKDADMKAAAFNALGAIALQGVRQADLRLGETCAVIGLGIVGAMICQLLDAAGVKVVGIDVGDAAVAKALALGIDAKLRSAHGLEAEIAAMTDGLGLDAVIIAAGADSLDPVNFAGRIARRKGRVVVVGAVPTGFDRNPDYYPKELELRMSCSYGPGRYDLDYEEKGVDYPAAYCRWTEKRNMQAFQDLAYRGRIKVADLVTHLFRFDDAPKAYEMILARSEFFLGVLLEYDAARTPDAPLRDRRFDPIRLRGASDARNADAKLPVRCAFVGAGSYAQGSLLPYLPKDRSLARPVLVATRSGATSRRVAEKFGFDACASGAEDVFTSRDVDLVFITTRHNLHAPFVLRALQEGKDVYVEKPLCITLDDYLAIRRAWDERAALGRPARLVVGFNRRFAPTADALKRALDPNLPIMLQYRVNAGAIPAHTWIQDPEIGGGRVLGEVCHFVDFAAWLAGAAVASVYAAAIPDPAGLGDTLSVQLRLANGSVASIAYCANGGKSLPKERIEVAQAGVTGVLDDFRSLMLYSDAGAKTIYKGIQNKGQASMLAALFNAYAAGGDDPIPAEEAFNATLATFAILDSLRSGAVVSLDR